MSGDSGKGGYVSGADLLAEARRAKAAKEAEYNKSATGRLVTSEAQRRDDHWRLQQLAASGAHMDEESTRALNATADLGSSSSSGPRLTDLRVNRALLAEFLGGGGGDGGQPLVLSRQQELVMPVKDPKSDFAELASAGSKVLREMQLKKNQRDETVSAVLGKKDSDIAALTGAGPSAGAQEDDLTAEELEAARRRLRNAERRNATGDELKALEQQDAAVARAQAKQNASLALESTIPTPEEAAEILQKRRSLPVYACKNELLAFVRQHSVTVIAGETGSGKTTQIVQYLLGDGYTRGEGIIGCTQPRRMAAVGVAHRVSREVGCELGSTVGYSIRLDDQTSRDTKIKFMTDGVLLQELINDRLLSKYRVVVMDEAHERSVNTDVLLGAMKEILRQRLDFRLLVMSATMDLVRFSAFFANAPIFTIPGRTFPIQTTFAPSNVMDYVESATLKVLEIHAGDAPGDILIFMTGRDDVEGTCEMIKAKCEEHMPHLQESLLVLPCYSMLPSTQQKLILEPAPRGQRKCIVATNIAETSLTIDGITHVIDSGFMKCKVYKPSIGINALQLYPVSRAQANQRQGRAGRTTEGFCHRMYTMANYLHETLDVPVPEIQRSSVDNVVLLLKSIGVQDLAVFDFLDPPPQKNVEASLGRLWLLGALDDMGRITDAGRRIADFPSDPPLARTMLEACQLGCGEEVASIAAILSADAGNVFVEPKGRQETARAAHERFYAPDSDHVTLLNVYEQFTDHGQSRSWADDHFLNFLVLKRALDIRQQFVDRLVRNFKLTLGSCAGAKDVVREAFAAGYFANAAKRTGLREYTTLLSGVPCAMQSSCAVLKSGSMPDFVVYNDFVLTNREFMSVVSAVDAAWLVKVSRGLFVKPGDEEMMQHHVRLIKEQRKALASSALQPQQQRRPPQPSAETLNIASGSAPPAAPAAAPPGKKFVPRRKK